MFATTFLLLIFLLSIPGLALAQDNTLPDKPVVVVSASGLINVTPDQARISMAVLKTDPSLTKALQANNLTTEQVMSALKKAGISGENIKTSNFSVYPEYDYSEKGRGKITSYQVRNEISVLVNNLDRVGEILNTAINSGANTLNYINFTKADTLDAENQALTQAVNRARDKALVLSNAAGRNLGRLINISEGYSQPIPYSNVVYAESAKGMGDAAVPINPGELQISANVTLIYELE